MCNNIWNFNYGQMEVVVCDSSIQFCSWKLNKWIVQVQAVGFIRPPYYRVKNGISFYFPRNVCFILRWWWWWWLCNREEPSGELVLSQDCYNNPYLGEGGVYVHAKPVLKNTGNSEWSWFCAYLCISLRIRILLHSEERCIELQESLLTIKCEKNFTLCATLKIIIWKDFDEAQL